MQLSVLLKDTSAVTSQAGIRTHIHVFIEFERLPGKSYAVYNDLGAICCPGIGYVFTARGV